MNLPYQTSYAILTDCLVLAKQLGHKFGSFLSEKITKVDYRLVVSRTPSSYLLDDGNSVSIVPDPLRAIEDFIFDHTIYDDSVFAIHGAAVAYRNHAYLFPAATMSGKTTLTAYLTMHGFDYLTDDCILISREDLSIIPHPTPLHLREGGLEVLRRYYSSPLSLKHVGAGDSSRYTYMPNNAIHHPLPLGGILFITRTAQENALLDISINERMIALMRNPITQYPITGEYVRFVARLAQQRCFDLHYCDMKYVEQVLHDLQ